MDSLPTEEPLLPCPYCGNNAKYYPQSDGQAAAIYCTECPLGVEESGMSYNALAAVWNYLPRYAIQQQRVK